MAIECEIDRKNGNIYLYNILDIIDDKDIKNIEKKWEKITKTNVNLNKNKPQLLYKSEDIIEKMLIDLTEKNIEKIVVNEKQEKENLEKLIEENKEYKNIKIELSESKNIFDIYDLEKQIKKIKNRKIWLKCGGFITIDKTEALTAIDVNTGKYTGNKNLEQTVFKVNSEASIEIAKQLRLRDIGGIIIIDYIDMLDDEHKKEIIKVLEESLKQDRSKTQIVGFSKLNLLEMTRKHMKGGE